MALTYEAKTNILLHMATPENWSNIFDLDNPTRHRHFLQISFNVNEWADHFADWKNYAPPAVNAYNITKLLVGHDMGIEPSLRARNTLHPDALKRFLDRLPKATQYGEGVLESFGDIGEQIKQKHITEKIEHTIRKIKSKNIASDIENPWRDTTEFTGYDVETPRNFSSTSIGNDTFEIRMSLGDREKMWSFGPVFTHAAQHGMEFNLDNTSISFTELFEAIASGQETQDHRNKDWIYQQFTSPAARQISRDIRSTLTSNFNLAREGFFVVNHTKEAVLVGVRSDVFNKVDIAQMEDRNKRINTAFKDMGLG